LYGPFHSGSGRRRARRHIGNFNSTKSAHR
jgi:hypothetical protein